MSTLFERIKEANYHSYLITDNYLLYNDPVCKKLQLLEINSGVKDINDICDMCDFISDFVTSGFSEKFKGDEEYFNDEEETKGFVIEELKSAKSATRMWCFNPDLNLLVIGMKINSNIRTSSLFIDTEEGRDNFKSLLLSVLNDKNLYLSSNYNLYNFMDTVKFYDEDDNDEHEDDYNDEYEDYDDEEEFFKEEDESAEALNKTHEGDIMKNLRETFQTAVVMNKNGLVNAATVTAGKALNKKATDIISNMKGVPSVFSMVAKSPFGEALVGNIIAIGIMSFSQDPKALMAANAMIQAGSFQVMENLDVEGFLNNLLSGVNLVAHEAPIEIPLPAESAPKAAKEKK